MGLERRGRVVRVRLVVNRVPGRSQVSESKSQVKPFDIPKQHGLGGVSEGQGQ